MLFLLRNESLYNVSTWFVHARFLFNTEQGLNQLQKTSHLQRRLSLKRLCLNIDKKKKQTGS